MKKKAPQPGVVNIHDPSREIVKLIEKAARLSGYQRWQIWDDFIYLSAAELSQVFDRRQDREDEYIRRAKNYDKETVQIFPELFAALIMAMEGGFFADVLGDAYMKLELNSHWHGQFFTPYNVCEMMAKMTIGNEESVKAIIEKRRYISINDPCCGAGGMLIGSIEALRDININYQWDALFVGQDIDPICALMCYIQLSLLGVPGIVQIGNTITYQYHDTWYTPMYMLRRYRFYNWGRQEEEPATDTADEPTIENKEAATPEPEKPLAPPTSEQHIWPSTSERVSDTIILPQPILDEKTGQYCLF